MDFETIYKEFIDYDCDRKKYIQDFLNKQGLDCPVIQLEGKNHLYVKFPISQYNPMFKIKTVIAHYDRFPESPGANDNSSSVISLMFWACDLIKREQFHNIRILFTDGEELGENGVNEQGAFALAKLFRKLNILNDDIFVFDSTGRGKIPILCQTNLPKKCDRKFIEKFNDLENRAKQLLTKACGNRWFVLPCNYSDNASFIANAIPAVAITMLPEQEVNLYLTKGVRPETWQLFHTKSDNYESLTGESFMMIRNILSFLGEIKTLA